MGDDLMCGKFLAEPSIGAEVVGHQRRAAARDFHDDWPKRLRGYVGAMDRWSHPVPFNQRQNGFLAGWLLAKCPVLGFAADHCFVGLDNLTFASEWADLGRLHRFADA